MDGLFEWTDNIIIAMYFKEQPFGIYTQYFRYWLPTDYLLPGIQDSTKHL
jgi:ABC-type multidrug transport system permease subunit